MAAYRARRRLDRMARLLPPPTCRQTNAGLRRRATIHPLIANRKGRPLLRPGRARAEAGLDQTLAADEQRERGSVVIVLLLAVAERKPDP